jgi:hypothetical protein
MQAERSNQLGTSQNRLSRSRRLRRGENILLDYDTILHRNLILDVPKQLSSDLKTLFSTVDILSQNICFGYDVCTIKSIRTGTLNNLTRLCAFSSAVEEYLDSRPDGTRIYPGCRRCARLPRFEGPTKLSSVIC